MRPPTPVIKAPTLHENSCGRVLTSEQNLRILNEKEQRKQEEARRKQEKKQEREKKKQEKEKKRVTFKGK